MNNDLKKNWDDTYYLMQIFMDNETLILEAGSEGGSVRLLQVKNYFIYTTDETTLIDFDPELRPEELKSKSNVFTSFETAMESMLDRYPVFRLYPLGVHPDFRFRILPWYQKYCSENDQEQNRSNKKWAESIAPDF